jgi:hypothetical protein
MLEINMRNRKQPPLASSMFADHSSFDVFPSSQGPKSPSSSSQRKQHPSVATSASASSSSGRDINDRSFLQEYDQSSSNQLDSSGFSLKDLIHKDSGNDSKIETESLSSRSYRSVVPSSLDRLVRYNFFLFSEFYSSPLNRKLFGQHGLLFLVIMHDQRIIMIS